MRQEIFSEIDAERIHQVTRWGNEVDDEQNRPNDWMGYISFYMSRWFGNTFPPYNEDTIDAFRESMIKTAALAIAAIESIDRQREQNGRVFYQTKD